MNTNNTKDTIYVDVDDDITGIIEKVRTSKDKIVALVLPKRATMLQSIVNMKLLKRSAGTAKKNLVLITSEAHILPLAGAVGLHVAKTLQSKPLIPKPPSTDDDKVETLEGDETDEDSVDKTKSVGELAGMPADEDETINVDNEADDPPSGGKKSKNKKLKIPNFESFRLRLFLGIGGFIFLILLWVLFTKVLPKAKITITTDSATIATNIDFTADTNVKDVNEAGHILPATQKTFSKTDTEKLAATGQKDQGTKATGTMTLTNCINDGQPHTVPAGTSFSSGSLSFVTDQAVTLDPALFSGSTCKSANFGLSKNVGATAAQAGNQYNLSARSYSSSINGINASGSDMSGGTSKIIKVVAQADLDAAKQKMFDRNNELAKAELVKQLQADKQFAITETFLIPTPNITSEPKVSEEAGDVTVTMTVDYKMLGVKQEELSKFVETEVKKKIDTTKQTILNDGLGNAQATITEKKSETLVKVALQSSAEAGPQLDATAIKSAVKGLKRGDTQKAIESRPGIKEVKIEYSPFWVGKTPSRTSRITVNFIQPNGQPSKQ